MFKRCFTAMLLAAALCSPVSALPKAPEKATTAYFAQFNGYKWGTPIETILKDAKMKNNGKPKFFMMKGVLDLYKGPIPSNVPLSGFYYTKADNPDAKKFFKYTTWNAGWHDVNDQPVENCDYYFVWHTQSSGKYPFAVYAVKDGVLIAGMFQMNQINPDRNAWYKHVEQIHKYILNNVQTRAGSDYNLGRNVFGRAVSGSIGGFIVGRDAAGACSVNLRHWLKAQTDFYLHVYSPKWIELFDHEEEMRNRHGQEFLKMQAKFPPKL